MRLLAAIIGLALMSREVRATCGNQTGGSCLSGTCNLWENAVCQWPRCVCPAGLCATNSTNGECIQPENHSAAPGNDRCEDLKVRQYWGPAATWHADQTIKRTFPFFVPFGMTCADLSTEEAPKRIAGILGRAANILQGARSVGVEIQIGAAAASGLGAVELLAEAVFGLAAQFFNSCARPQMINNRQAFGSPDEAMTAAQACCSCGGGTTASWRQPDSQTTVALQHIYDASGGETWIQSAGWNSQSHFCTWDYIRCNQQAELFSLSLFLNNVTGYLSDAIGNLSSMQMFITGLQAQLYCNTSAGTLDCSHMNSLTPGMSGTLPNSLSQLSLLSTVVMLQVDSVLAPLFRSLGANTSGISGSMPNLPAIMAFGTVDSKLSGTVPEFDFLNVLVDMTPVAGWHGISGTIPAVWSRANNLESLILVISMSCLSRLVIVGGSSSRVKAAAE